MKVVTKRLLRGQIAVAVLGSSKKDDAMCHNIYLGGFPSLYSIDEYFRITQIAIFINE